MKHGDTVTLVLPDFHIAGTQRVSAVKSVRQLTGLGLKESLDIVNSGPGKAQVVVCCPHGTTNDEAWSRMMAQELKNVGIQVSGLRHDILNRLRELAKEALDGELDQLSIDITHLVLAETLREE